MLTEAHVDVLRKALLAEDSGRLGVLSWPGVARVSDDLCNMGLMVSVDATVNPGGTISASLPGRISTFTENGRCLANDLYRENVKLGRKHLENWFSNFIPFSSPMEYGGELYPTPEHYFQAMKTLDVDERAFVASQKTPGGAKHCGRKVELRENWEGIKRDVMLYVQRRRFKGDARMGLKLMQTGNYPVVEWNTWHDNVWGRCICPRCKCQGRNMLGEILVEVREELREAQRR